MKRRIMLFAVLALLCSMLAAAQNVAPAKAPDNVNVVNTPTVQLAGTSTVLIGNDSATPVPVQDVSKKRTPFQVNQNFGPSPFLNDSLVSFPITVPVGKRLVIEHVSARAALPFGGQTPFVLFSISTTVAGVSVQHFLDVPQVFIFNCASCGTTNAHNVVSQEIKLFSDAGQTVQVTALAASQTGQSIDVNFAMSGYLEDAP